MKPEPIQHVIIAGGGTAGWMTAAALSKAFAGSPMKITLVESDEIGTIGVGEATIPAIHFFNTMLGIDQAEFMRTCQATFKLGIEFVDWGDIGRRYIHPFTTYGRDLNNVFFHELWLKYAGMKAAAGEVSTLDDYNLCCVAARNNRFTHPVGGERVPVGAIKYAFHFDASLYARFLRTYSEKRDVTRLEGKIRDVRSEAETGFLQALVLEDGQTIEGDLFIDCTGQRALLIEQSLKSGFVAWRHWLPCDRAVAVPCANAAPAAPYTRSTADTAGWRWRIPLQHRVGNGYVFSSAFIDDEAAERRLLESLDGEPLAAPRRIPFVTGRRKAFWIKNCVAIGLASGFLEPLESTSIHLIQTGVLKLLALFPDKGFEAADIAAYNRHTEAEYERLRDFLILHYKVTQRDDTLFWRYCQAMEVPDSVNEAIELFAARGRMLVTADHLFTGASWMSVMTGQGLTPRGYNSLVDTIPNAELEAHMRSVRDYIAQTTQAMPFHHDYVARFCRETQHAD
ncbi:Flavin-dependent tryptophan halogenase RebH (plasmid) [Asticcacaulis sp. MM231]|uniref:tryptophan halogenase family protein n=1 Tax=Asticcacaulis sp. MM231 TaxID=3157666 RepID=UPI0032D57355